MAGLYPLLDSAMHSRSEKSLLNPCRDLINVLVSLLIKGSEDHFSLIELWQYYSIIVEADLFFRRPALNEDVLLV